MNSQNTKAKRIGIDARMYGPVGKGLGRYAKEVVDNVIAIDKKNKYVIFLTLENYDILKIADSNVKKVIVRAKWYTLAEQIVMPYYIWKERVDLMHFTHFNVPILNFKKFIVTIHDLILTKFPTKRATTLNPLFYFLKNIFYKITIYLAVKRAKTVIAVSEYTKNDIKNKFRVKNKKIKVIYEGVAQDIKIGPEKNDNNAILRYNIKSPYILYVGNAYPHKNLEGLIEVFYEVVKIKPEINLILVGKDDYFYLRLKKALKNTDREQNIIFTGFVPDQDLAAIYKGALFYVFPSFYEGFGLPPLEAMAHGCPVLSSQETCLKEVLGDAALYFDPYSQDDMRQKIIKMIKDVDLRKELTEKGYGQAQKYSWQDCAKHTLEIYNKF